MECHLSYLPPWLNPSKPIQRYVFLLLATGTFLQETAFDLDTHTKLTIDDQANNVYF